MSDKDPGKGTTGPIAGVVVATLLPISTAGIMSHAGFSIREIGPTMNYVGPLAAVLLAIAFWTLHRRMG